MEVVLVVLVRILETLFLVGIVGSAIVIVLSGIEDVETIFEPDEPSPGLVTKG